MHIDKDLGLKHVVFVPDLTTQIGEIADVSLLTLKLHSPQNSVYKVVIHTEEHTDARVGNRCVFELYKRDREVQYAFNEYERYAWLRKRKFQGCVGYLIVE